MNWWQWVLPAGFFAATDAEAWWGTMFGSLARPSQRAWLMAALESAVFSLLFLLAAVQFAAWKLRRSWQDEPPSARRLWLEQKFCTPVVGVNFFHRWLRKKLERNPIGWLEQRTWTGRLVTWGWFAVMISFYSAVFYVPNVNTLLAAVQKLMAWSLLTLISVSAAGSFQRERETRVLELLLVSPMTLRRHHHGTAARFVGAIPPGAAAHAGRVDIPGGNLHAARGFCPDPLFLRGLCHAADHRALLFPETRHLHRLLFVHAPRRLGAAPGPAVSHHHRRRNLFSLFDSLLESGIRPGGGLTMFSWLNAYARNHFLALPIAVVFFQSAIAIRLGRKLYQSLLHRTFAFSTSPA